MFETLIVQPIFNLLVLITAIIPGHNFGLAIVIFTIIIRLLLYPLVKKQLRHARAMRELQPELRRIKAATKGNRQQESALTMELYKEREINPFASLGVALVQLPILIGLYVGLRKIITNPHEIVTFSYPALHNLAWMKEIKANINNFDNTFLGIVNLTRTALGPLGVYWSALIIVLASGLAQYFQNKQLMPQDAAGRGLRQILRDANKGKQAEQSEVNAAVGKSTQFLIPFMVFIIGVRLAVALPLYWLTSSLVAYIQQSRILHRDAAEADASVEAPADPTERKKIKSQKIKKPSSKKRRRR